MDTLEVIKYGLLFLILSPGFLITLYPENKGYLLSNETNYYSIILHTFLLSFIITSQQASKKGKIDYKTNIETKDIIPITAILLFALLSPGLLLTIPSTSGKYFLSNETNRIAVVFHTFIFIIVFASVVFILKNNKKI